MKYYFQKSVDYSFDETITRATKVLQAHGFGILSTIDVQDKMREKLGVDFPKYTILGACNPSYAHQALEQELWIGIMLPCNVVVLENSNGGIEIAAVDPIASMQAIENQSLGAIAAKVRDELQMVIEEI